MIIFVLIFYGSHLRHHFRYHFPFFIFPEDVTHAQKYSSWTLDYIVDINNCSAELWYHLFGPSASWRVFQLSLSITLSEEKDITSVSFYITVRKGGYHRAFFSSQTVSNCSFLVYHTPQGRSLQERARFVTPSEKDRIRRNSSAVAQCE
jgi:hypothetical protein